MALYEILIDTDSAQIGEPVDAPVGVDPDPGTIASACGSDPTPPQSSAAAHAELISTDATGEMDARIAKQLTPRSTRR